MGAVAGFGFVILSQIAWGRYTNNTGDGILSVTRYQLGAGFVLFVRWLVGWFGKKHSWGFVVLNPKRIIDDISTSRIDGTGIRYIYLVKL